MMGLIRVIGRGGSRRRAWSDVPNITIDVLARSPLGRQPIIQRDAEIEVYAEYQARMNG
jgi:hypothetical protein